MNVPINDELIEQLKLSKGQQLVTIIELEQIAQLLTDKNAKALVINGSCYIVFAEIINVEFCIPSVNKRSALNFIPNGKLEFINTNKMKSSYTSFLLRELWQGKTFWARLRRSLSLLAPLALLNIFIYLFAGTAGIKDVLSGILAAVSIYIAIFSLFTTSADYLARKRLNLFESGQLGYYFAVDKHITKTGVYTIITSILCLITTSSYDPNKNEVLHWGGLADTTVWIGLNLCFLGVYLTLRSIVEFYVNRPANFIMSDLKQDSFSEYRKKNEDQP